MSKGTAFESPNWANLTSCWSERSREIPTLLGLLSGESCEAAIGALDALTALIIHQGTIYEVTPHAVRALVQMLAEGRVSHEPARNAIRLALNWKGLFRFVPKQHRAMISTKENPIDGSVLDQHGCLWTYRLGVLHGAYREHHSHLGGAPAKRVEGGYEDGKRSGAWVYYHPNGKVHEEGPFVADHREGGWTEWFEDGSRKSAGAYSRGKPSGTWTTWERNGQKGSEGTFKAGKPEGVWTTWFKDGRLASRGAYRAGKKNGPWEHQLADDPSVRISGSYKADKKDGPWLREDDNGQSVTLWEVGRIVKPVGA
jgi:antitoxin component YwqK of YwqJK toxin-antitoxin module